MPARRQRWRAGAGARTPTSSAGRGEGGQGGSSIHTPLLFLFACMRICTYNPLASNFSERIEDISAQLRTWDLILLNGTQKKALPDQAEERHNYIRHWSISCGYRKGRLINSSCGLSFLVTHRIRREALHEILRPPAGLQGRVAGIRIKDSTTSQCSMFILRPSMTRTTLR
eukprot:2404967-Pyramimonas_sp.AAC.1